MQCPKCNKELRRGLGIVPNGNAGWMQGWKGYYPVEMAYDHLYYVWKCPKCGHSVTDQELMEKKPVTIQPTNRALKATYEFRWALPNESEMRFFDRDGNEVSSVRYVKYAVDGKFHVAVENRA